MAEILALNLNPGLAAGSGFGCLAIQIRRLNAGCNCCAIAFIATHA
jgi:hypothetical protein